VIPVKNEEENLQRCLARLGRFTEIVVVDSSSVDRTAEIARRYGATLIDFSWDGRFPKKRNWVLLNIELKCEWVLFLDADELLDDRFCDAVAEAVQSKECVGYWLRYTNYFMGRKLRFGVSQRKLALFRIGAGLYEDVGDIAWTRLDMEVHEHPIIDGRVGMIRHKIEHDDHKGVAKFIERHREYAVWEARRIQLLRKRDIGDLTFRQRAKYRNVEKWWFASAYFMFQYVARLGFLDGAAGFYYAVMKAWYFMVVRLVSRERGITKGGG